MRHRLWRELGPEKALVGAAGWAQASSPGDQGAARGDRACPNLGVPFCSCARGARVLPFPGASLPSAAAAPPGPPAQATPSSGERSPTPPVAGPSFKNKK